MDKTGAGRLKARSINGALPISERRRFIRHPLCFPLKYKVLSQPGITAASSAASSKEKSSTTINISMGGLLFAAKKPVAAGSIITIRMAFQDKVFNVRSKVVYCGRNKETGLYNIGVHFYRIHDAFKVKLVEQLYLISEFRDLQSMRLGREMSLEEASREWIKRYSERFRRLYW